MKNYEVSEDMKNRAIRADDKNDKTLFESQSLTKTCLTIHFLNQLAKGSSREIKLIGPT